MKKIVNWVRGIIWDIKNYIQYRKKIKELRKKDPFNYKNF